VLILYYFDISINVNTNLGGGGGVLLASLLSYFPITRCIP